MATIRRRYYKMAFTGDAVIVVVVFCAFMIQQKSITELRKKAKEHSVNEQEHIQQIDSLYKLIDKKEKLALKFGMELESRNDALEKKISQVASSVTRVETLVDEVCSWTWQLWWWLQDAGGKAHSAISDKK